MASPEFIPGTHIRGVRDLTPVVRRIGEQAAVAANPMASGMIAGDVGATGARSSPTLLTPVECFELRTCWTRQKPPNDWGATKGRFWVCQGVPVGYWLNGSNPATSDRWWKRRDQTADDRMTPLWWPETSREDAQTWQKVLHPLYGIGQWVWCIYDHAAAVWRVIHAYDSIVRFRLRQRLRPCQHAQADVIGYPCRTVGSVGSSDSFSSGSSASSSCALGFSRGVIQLYDPLELTACADDGAPAGTQGWAKRMADTEHFEVLSIPVCAASSLVECCLMEDHPGYGIVFDVIVAKQWNADACGWQYYPGAQTAKAVDWRYGTPYPTAGARGLFQRRSSTQHGYIYECVSLDCESPGLCNEVGNEAAVGCGAGSSSSYSSGQ